MSPVLSKSRYAAYCLTGAALFVVVLAVDLHNSSSGYFSAQGLQIAFILQLVYSAGFVWYMHIRKEAGIPLFTIAVLYLGSLLRICYMLYTGPGTRTYDVYRDQWGHLDYIRYLADYLSLPPVNECQAYHPPVHHILSAAALSIGRVLFTDEFLQLKVVQALGTLLNILTLLTIRKILVQSGCTPAAILAGTAFMAFHPTHVYFASRINNDNTLFLFYTAALYAILQWGTGQNTARTVKMSFLAALAILTKFSGVMLLPVIGVACIMAYRQDPGRFRPLAGQLALFCALYLPLAASYTLRNYMLFGQLPGYVPSFGKAFTPSISNLVGIPVGSFLASPFNNGGLQGGEFFLEFLLKSSLFGEWKFPGLEAPAFLLLFTVLSLIVLFVMLSLLFWRRLQTRAGILLLVNLLVPFLLEMKFRTDFPVACSQDFRYMAPVLVSMAYFLGKSSTLDSSSWQRSLQHVASGFLVLFCITSAGFVLLLASSG